MKNLSLKSGRRSILNYPVMLLLFITFSPGADAAMSNSLLILLAPGNGIQKHIPIDAVFYNACCDEQVHVTGTAHFLVNKNVIHVVVQDLSGVGLTTNSTYMGIGASVETNVMYSNQFEGILTFHMNLFNNEGCSFKLKLTFQLHVNAIGDVTAKVLKIDVKCDE